MLRLQADPGCHCVTGNLSRIQLEQDRPTLSRGIAVLSKCANPACSVQFRYLRHGKVFEVETRYFGGSAGDETGKVRNSGHVEFYWLCDQCTDHIALGFDRQLGMVTVSTLGGSGRASVMAIPRSNPKAGAGFARVSIRPSVLSVVENRELLGQMKPRRPVKVA